MNPSDCSAALPLPLPPNKALQAFLIILRRMAGHGLHDGRAAMLALDTFGKDFRKLLLLTRCFLIELTNTSDRRIMVAPCCVPRMTRDEGLIVTLVVDGELETYAALTGKLGTTHALSTATFLGEELRAVSRRRGWPAPTEIHGFRES